jgi:hypothetical protein
VVDIFVKDVVADRSFVVVGKTGVAVVEGKNDFDVDEETAISLV